MTHYHLVPDRSLHLRDPSNSAIGARILADGLALMNELGLEAFNFKKLADRAGTWMHSNDETNKSLQINSL